MTKESWIIIRRATGEVAFETCNPNTVELVDHSKACVMPALVWLQAVNRASVMAEEAKSNG